MEVEEGNEVNVMVCNDFGERGRGGEVYMGTHSWYSSMDGEHGGDRAMSAWKCEYVFSFILVVVEKEEEVSVSEVLKVERWHKQTSG